MSVKTSFQLMSFNAQTRARAPQKTEHTTSARKIIPIARLHIEQLEKLLSFLGVADFFRSQGTSRTFRSAQFRGKLVIENFQALGKLFDQVHKDRLKEVESLDITTVYGEGAKILRKVSDSRYIWSTPNADEWAPAADPIEKVFARCPKVVNLCIRHAHSIAYQCLMAGYSYKSRGFTLECYSNKLQTVTFLNSNIETIIPDLRMSDSRTYFPSHFSPKASLAVEYVSAPWALHRLCAMPQTKRVICASTELQDIDLQRCSENRTIVQMGFRDALITKEGLKHIVAIPSLRRLEIVRCRNVTDTKGLERPGLEIVLSK